MGILFHCSECKRPLNVGGQLASKDGVCPNCKKSIRVPGESQMVPAEFRTRLNQWTRGQMANGPPHRPVEDRSGSAAVGSTKGVGIQPAIQQPAIQMADSKSKIVPASGKAELDSRVLTEAEKIAQGISGTLGQQRPDPLAQQPDGVWYVRPPSGGQFGPVSAHLVREWTEQGRITPDSWIWCEGWEEWSLAGKVLPAFAGVEIEVTDSEQGADPVGAAKTRTSYLKARRRRTMIGTVGLLIGTVIIVVLLVIMFLVIQR